MNIPSGVGTVLGFVLGLIVIIVLHDLLHHFNLAILG